MRTYRVALLLCIAFVFQIGYISPASAEEPGTLAVAARIQAQADTTAALTFAQALGTYAEAVENRTVCPVPGAPMSDDFGAPRAGHSHQGNDLLAPTGTPILAPQAGTATYRDVSVGGLSVFLNADDGTEWFVTHMSATGTEGHVTPGTVIGYVGDDGNAAGTPHAHTEMHVGGVAVDPYPWLVEACTGVPGQVALPESGASGPRVTFVYSAGEVVRWLRYHRAGTRYGRAEVLVIRGWWNAITWGRVAAYVRAAYAGDLVWHWQLVANCESGDRVDALSPSGYMGWLQFDQSSWSANGGSGSPLGQPREVAARVAENYRLRSGTAPWPTCGRYYR